MKVETVVMVPTDQLVCRPQVREQSGMSEDEIASLAASIQEVDAILQPLIARKEGDSRVVLDGHRRLLAARRLGLKTVPVIVLENELDAAEVLHRQLVLDAQRVSLSPIERMKAIKRLMEAADWTAAQVAEKLGVSTALVSKLLTLQVLPDAIQDEVGAGRLAMSTAYLLAKIKNARLRGELAQQVLTGGLSREELARLIRQAERQPDRKLQPIPPRRRQTTLTLRPCNGSSVTFRGSQLTHGSVLELIAMVDTQLRSISGADASRPDWHATIAHRSRNEDAA